MDIREMLEKCKPFAPVVSAAVVAACVAGSLYGYKVPVYETKASVEDTQEQEDEVPVVKTSTEEETKEDEAAEEEEQAKGSFDLEDGVYQGSGTKIGGNITVAVTIKDKQITSIEILSASDDEPFFGRAKGLIDQIIKKQSTKVDTVSGATPLAAVKAGEKVDLLSLFLGNTQGTIGETSALAILIGAAFLLILKVIDWRIPCTYIGSFAIFVILFGGHGADGYYLLEQLLGGGLMLGAWFMATDYVTTPITKRGQLVYGVILGCLTGLFRIFGASAEGVSYAIIFGNLLIPVIERLTVPTAFGKGGVKHEK